MSAWVSATDLAAMRSIVNGIMAGTAIIQTHGALPDPYGAVYDTYTASGTVSARADFIAESREIVVGGEFHSIPTYRVIIPHGSTVTAADRILYGSHTLEVLEVDDSRDDATHMRLICREVTP